MPISTTRKNITDRLKKMHQDKFVAEFGIVRELSQSEKEKFFGQERGHLIIRPGKEVPEKAHHAKYYLREDNTVLVKAEPYRLDGNDLVNYLTFCAIKGWTICIVQGYESYRPGETITVVFFTNKPLPNNGKKSNKA